MIINNNIISHDLLVIRKQLALDGKEDNGLDFCLDSRKKQEKMGILWALSLSLWNLKHSWFEGYEVHGKLEGESKEIIT